MKYHLQLNTDDTIYLLLYMLRYIGNAHVRKRFR